ncbi:MAG TPA: rhomboid family intramembrane serine protease [Chitinophagaceae bacterium]
MDADNGKIRGLYYMIAGAVLFVPILFTIPLAETVSGKLTRLESVIEMTQKPDSRYYTINSFKPDKDNVGIESSWSYSGKHNEYLNFNIYIVAPVISTQSQSPGRQQVYLAVKYHESVSSKISEELKKVKWEVFWDESFKKFESDSLSFTYFSRMKYSDEKDNFIKAVRDSPLYTGKQEFLILKGFQEPFEQRNGNKPFYTFLSLAIGLFVWFLMVIIPGIHLEKARQINSRGNISIIDQLKKVYQDLEFVKVYTTTSVIIGLNVLIFLIMVLCGFGFVQFSGSDLVTLGACYKPKVSDGEWWRLITSMFLHGGVMHLVMNMVGLALAGLFLEIVIGSKRFAFTYLISGIVAGLVSLWWHDKPVVAVGASGAIFGAYGTLLAFVVFRIIDKSLLLLLGVTAGYGLLIGLFTEGVDNSAHVGGLITGFILGLFFSVSIKSRRNNELV